MKTYHTASSTEGLRLPYSGLLVGKLADALRLKGIFNEGFSAASYKTVQRYFCGERIEPEVVEAVFDALVDALVPRGIDLPSNWIGGPEISLHKLIGEALRYYARRWDQLAADVNTILYPVTEPRDLPIPILRLVVLELGLRYGCWLAIGDMKEARPPEVKRWWMDPRGAGTFIDDRRAAASLTVAALAEAVGVSAQALEAWRSGRSLPTGANIERLAKALAPEPTKVGETELRLRVHVALFDVRDELISLCGADRINDMLEAVAVTAKNVRLFFVKAVSGVQAMPTPDIRVGAGWEVLKKRTLDAFRLMQWSVILKGAECEAGKGLSGEMAKAAAFRDEVAADFLALPGTWADRCRYWMDHLGTAKKAVERFTRAHPADRLMPASDIRGIAEAVHEAQLHMGNFDHQPDFEGAHMVTFRLPPFERAMSRAHQASRAASAGNLALAVEHYRHAVKAQPEDPALHFHLGGQLWQHGWKIRDTSLMEEGMLECRVAVQLDPDFGNARNEIGVILSNLRRHEEAEAAFAEAEPYHGDQSHHWLARGNNLLGMQRHESARAAFEKAIERSAGKLHPEAMMRLAGTLMAMGLRQQARRLGKKVEHILDFDPTKDWKKAVDVWGDLRAQEAGLPRAWPG